MRILILGTGKMGKLFAKLFSKVGEVILKNKPEQIEDVVIVAKSIKDIPQTLNALKKIARTRKKTAMVFDISTFKKDLVRYYVDFPEYINVASVHPMFGPGTKSVRGKRFVIVPIPGREKDSEKIAEFIEGLGGHVVFTTPEEHDKLMGYVISIPYAIGLAYLCFSLEKKLFDYGGTSFEFLTTYGKAVLNDSPQLIEEIIERGRSEIEEFLNFLYSFNSTASRRLRKIFSSDIAEAYEKFYLVADYVCQKREFSKLSDEKNEVDAR